MVSMLGIQIQTSMGKVLQVVAEFHVELPRTEPLVVTVPFSLGPIGAVAGIFSIPFLV